MIRASVLFGAVIASGLLWLGLVLGVPALKQARLFCENGADLFGDFGRPKRCSCEARPYDAKSVSRCDRCYPAICYDAVRPFDADQVEGGLAFTALGAALFLLSAGLLMGDGRTGAWLALGAVASSAPFLFCLERANPIFFAGAGVMTFLAWFESDSMWKRQTAIFALAVACAFKLVPGVFALFLVERRRWQDLIQLTAEGMALLLIPFAWAGGFAGIRDWIACMQAHMDFYCTGKAIGFVRIARGVAAHALGMNFEPCSLVYRLARILDVTVGVWALVRFFRSSDFRSKVLLLAAAMVLIPGMAQYYAYLYFVPGLVLSAGMRLSIVEALGWFAICCPLCIPRGVGIFNYTLADFGFLGLLARALL